MRDLGAKWTAVPDWSNAVLEAPGLKVVTRLGLIQHLVSGDLEAFAARAGLSGTGVGAFALADGDRYMVRLARDRVLAVGDPGFDASPGWHDAGFAVTPMSAGFHVFEIAGRSVSAVVSRATTLDPSVGSPSASMAFAGAAAVAYFHGDAETLRLHVDRGLAAYLWTWLSAVAGNLSGTDDGGRRTLVDG
ncbi:MAG: hypothetical protein ACLPSW_13665 [Roseiarcus sp.]